MRLLALHAYLNGDLKPTPRQQPQPAQPDTAAADGAAGAEADGMPMEVDGENGSAKPEPVVKAKPLEPVSRWASVCSIKQEVAAVAWVTAGKARSA